ncbi:DUF927 domain-containing protein [Citromicrobium bathyomarinum]
MKFQITVSQSDRKYLSGTKSPEVLVLVDELLVSRSARNSPLCSNAGSADLPTRDELTALLADTSEYRHEIIVEHPGWTTGDIFAHIDGNISTREPVEAPKSILALTAGAPRQGSHEAWLKGVAKPLAKQPIPITVFSLALVSALRPLVKLATNPGLQLIGPPATGKTTLLQLASSLSGPPSAHLGFPSVIAAETVEADEGTSAQIPQDHFLAIDDLTNVGATTTSPARRRALHRLASGLLHGQIGASGAELCRHAFIVAGNQSFEDWAQATDDHLPYSKIPAIDLSAHDAFGIFDCVPDNFASASALASYLLASAAANHGHALPRLIDYILAQDPEELEETITSRIAKFNRKVKADGDDGTVVRTAELFGLIYAAGHLGQEAGALPEEWEIGPSVEQCYLVYQRAKAPPRPFLDRLSDLVEHDQIMEVPIGGLTAKKSTRRSAEAAFGFSKRQGKDIELWLRRDHIQTLLPDWPIEKRSRTVRDLMVLEKDRLMVKRKVFKKGKPERFYVFKFNEDDAWKLAAQR